MVVIPTTYTSKEKNYFVNVIQYGDDDVTWN